MSQHGLAQVHVSTACVDRTSQRSRAGHGAEPTSCWGVRPTSFWHGAQLSSTGLAVSATTTFIRAVLNPGRTPSNDGSGNAALDLMILTLSSRAGKLCIPQNLTEKEEVRIWESCEHSQQTVKQKARRAWDMPQKTRSSWKCLSQRQGNGSENGHHVMEKNSLKRIKNEESALWCRHQNFFAWSAAFSSKSAESQLKIAAVAANFLKGTFPDPWTNVLAKKSQLTDHLLNDLWPQASSFRAIKSTISCKTLKIFYIFGNFAMAGNGHSSHFVHKNINFFGIEVKFPNAMSLFRGKTALK